MNIYLLDALYILTILVAILAYRTMYGWKFVLFSEYSVIYIVLYTLLFGIPLIYSLFKYVKTRNDPTKDRPITASKWMGVLFVLIFVIGFNILIYPSLRTN